MLRVKNFIDKYKLLIIVFILLLFLTISIVYASQVEVEDSSNEVIEKDDIGITNVEEAKNAEEANENEKIRVDIKGYVKNPGVYELDLGSRVIDVIKMAGGLIEGANTEYINLSKKISDEMIIIIYSNMDVEKYKETDKEIIYVQYECVCPDNINDACISETDTVNTTNIEKEQTIIQDDKVSINSATLEELMSLTGIGEAKAKAIMEYREKNGEFKTLEEIMNVSGIGEAAYSKIKDNIKL